jgi:1-acyl-sn-glycerol-3-phosphate acyltransferase
MAVRIAGDTAPLSTWYDRITAMPLTPTADGVLMSASGVRLYREHYAGWRRLADGLSAGRYARRWLDNGRLVLRADALCFVGRRRTLTLPLPDLAGVTIESNTVIVSVRRRHALFFRFAGGIGKCWEDALRKTLDDHHRPAVITTYYPRLRLDTEDARGARPCASRPGAPLTMTPLHGRPLLFALLRSLVRHLVYRHLPVVVHGRRHVPSAGAAVVLANHGSLLDAILLGAALPRPIRFMAKDSEFDNPLLAGILSHLRAFPVRRHAVDAHAVRTARRIVQNDHILGLFPEGERTWDGRRLPLRRGALRLLLSLGVPLIPVGIAGTYAMMPRWTHRIRRHPVTIRFGAPIQLPALASGLQTDEAITALDHLLQRCMADLLGSCRG